MVFLPCGPFHWKPMGPREGLLAPSRPPPRSQQTDNPPPEWTGDSRGVSTEDARHANSELAEMRHRARHEPGTLPNAISALYAQQSQQGQGLQEITPYGQNPASFNLPPMAYPSYPIDYSANQHIMPSGSDEQALQWNAASLQHAHLGFNAAMAASRVMQGSQEEVTTSRSRKEDAAGRSEIDEALEAAVSPSESEASTIRADSRGAAHAHPWPKSEHEHSRSSGDRPTASNQLSATAAPFIPRTMPQALQSAPSALSSESTPRKPNFKLNPLAVKLSNRGELPLNRTPLPFLPRDLKSIDDSSFRTPGVAQPCFPTLLSCDAATGGRPVIAYGRNTIPPQARDAGKKCVLRSSMGWTTRKTDEERMTELERTQAQERREDGAGTATSAALFVLSDLKGFDVCRGEDEELLRGWIRGAALAAEAQEKEHEEDVGALPDWSV